MGDGLSAVMRPKGRLDYNRLHINDLPNNEPARKHLGEREQNQGLAFDANAAHGTARAHRDTCYDMG